MNNKRRPVETAPKDTTKPLHTPYTDTGVRINPTISEPGLFNILEPYESPVGTPDITEKDQNADPYANIPIVVFGEAPDLDMSARVKDLQIQHPVSKSFSVEYLRKDVGSLLEIEKKK